MKTDITKEQSEQKRFLNGKIVSTKMNNSVVVEIPRTIRHPIYKKALHRSHRFLAHCDSKDYVVGDMVQIVETRPQSRNKHFRVVSKLIL